MVPYLLYRKRMCMAKYPGPRRAVCDTCHTFWRPPSHKVDSLRLVLLRMPSLSARRTCGVSRLKRFADLVPAPHVTDKYRGDCHHHVHWGVNPNAVNQESDTCDLQRQVYRVQMEQHDFSQGRLRETLFVHSQS